MSETKNFPVHPVTGLRAVGIVAGRPVWPVLGADTRGDAAVTTRLDEIDTRRESLRTEILAFEGRDLDDTEAESFRSLTTEWDTLETEREPLAERAANIERIRTALVTRRGLEHVGDGPTVQRTVEPFADLDQVRGGQLDAGDLRSRALAAVDQVGEHTLSDEQRERCDYLLRHNDRHGRIARHMLLTGSPEYQRAFEALLGGTQPWQLRGELADALGLADEHMRAMNEGTNSAGGYLVPFLLDPTIILTSAGSTNPMRQISDVKSITNKRWNGVTSAGVTAEWLAEAAEVGDDSPTFAQPGIDTHRASAWLQASFEVTQDTNIASEVGMLLADAKDTLEATAFVVGTGSGQPKGAAVAVAAVGGSVVATATASTYAVADVYKLAGAVPPRFRQNASWLAEYNTYLKTRQFASGSGPQHAFWADLGMNTPAELLGRPTYESSAMVNTLADNSIPLLCGDFKRGYTIIDRIGMQVQFEPLVKGSSRRPTGEVGWFAHWRVGGDSIVPNALRALKVLAGS